MDDDIPNIPNVPNIPQPSGPQQVSQTQRNPGLQHVAGRIQRTTVQSVQHTSLTGAVLTTLLLLGVVLLVWWASNPQNLALTFQPLLNLFLHQLLVWFSWYGGGLIFTLLVVAVLQSVFRFNVLGPLARLLGFCIKWMILALFWLVVMLPLQVLQLMLQRPLVPAHPQSRTVQTVVLIQADQSRRVLVVFAAPHEVLLHEGDEIQGSGFSWRGKTRMHHIYNQSTGQTWRAIL